MGLSEYLLRETLGFNMAPAINAMKRSDLFGQPPVRSCNAAFDHANALKSALERYNRSRGSHRPEYDIRGDSGSVNREPRTSNREPAADSS